MAKELDKVTGATPKAAARRTQPPELERSGNGTVTNEPTGEWGRLVAGAGNTSVVAGLVTGLCALGSRGKKVDRGATDFALGFADGMKPRDAAESLLLAQMAATHQATMMLARRLNHVESIPQQDAAERAFNKCARTFAAQMDTLKRYRSKGQQTVRVERVNVESGGQAIVGNVETETGKK